MPVQYCVVNEHTLGCYDEAHPEVICILSSSVLRGATVDWTRGPLQRGASDKVRPAMREDFVTYRIHQGGYKFDEKGFALPRD